MKLTQIELAEKINYSDKAISKWERGESIPDVSVLLNLAKLFGVNIDFLVTEHNNTEIAKEQTNYAAGIKKKNHLLISAITFLAMLIAETIVFISLQGSGAVTSVWRNIINFIAVSALIWTILADAFFIILLCGRSFPLVFVLGFPAEIVAMMSFKIKILSVGSKKKPVAEKENPEEKR